MSEQVPQTVPAGHDVIAAYVRMLTGQPGVYRMLDAQARVLYVGKARNLKARVTSYARPKGHTGRILKMISETTEMMFLTTKTETEALLLEQNLIKQLKPKYNVLLRDDKSFPNILVTDHAYPMIKRHRGAKKEKGNYYGPFASARAVSSSLAQLQRIFLLRNCSDSDFETRTRPCLQYQIKRCSGPCVGKISEADYRDKLVDELMHGMLGDRFSEIGQKPDSPYAFAFNFTNEMGRQVDIFELVAFAKPGMVDRTLEVMTTEVERARRHGFLASEFDRQKSEMIREYERALKEKDKVDARAYTFEMVNHFLEGEAMPGRAVELELVKRFLPTITLEEVNQRVETWTSRKDRVVMASGAARDAMPKEEQLLAIVDQVSARDIKAYEEIEVGDTLMAKAPTAGSITAEEKVDGVDLTVWTLSNGAKVVVKATDFKNDEVLFRAISPGGTSLTDDRNYWSANSSDGIVAESGLGEFDAATVDKMMKGKVVRVNPYVYELEEGLRGSASPDDLEAMMQMIHLTFTAPRRDPAAFEAWKGVHWPSQARR